MNTRPDQTSISSKTKNLLDNVKKNTFARKVSYTVEDERYVGADLRKLDSLSKFFTVRSLAAQKRLKGGQSTFVPLVKPKIKEIVKKKPKLRMDWATMVSDIVAAKKFLEEQEEFP